ncbi:hypothetical protein EOL70_15710 [Leucothrix sargassi]|nr:hypothetical protein EOL70_15710 [Leucothrix sargassi]
MSLIRNTFIQPLLVVSLSALVSTSALAADKPTTNEKFALGYQFTVDSNGLSGRMAVNDKVTAQLILAPFGEVSSYVARARYHLATDKNWDGYGYVSLGVYSWDDDNVDEDVLAIGGGIGMEYDWQNLSSSYPPITWSLELDANAAEFDNFDFSKFAISIGAHYRF